MATLERLPEVSRPGSKAPSRRRLARPAERFGGARGNERLTALTGSVLLVLLAIEGFTILGFTVLHMPRFIGVHIFVGMLLVGPVVLKLCSTLYRFVRYYSGSAPYRRKGPPAPLLRLLGPVIVATTVGMFASGIMLAVSGPHNEGPWLSLHQASFVIWFFAMTVHVLAYVLHLPRLVLADLRSRRSDAEPPPVPRSTPAGEGPASYSPAGHGPAYGRAMEIVGGRWARLALLITSLLGGLVIALATLHWATPW